MRRPFDVCGRRGGWYNYRMEMIKRVCDLETNDRAVLERVFVQPLEPSAEIVLTVKSSATTTSNPAAQAEGDGLPDWCNVLEGMSDAELAEFDAILNMPVRLGRTG